MIYDSRKTCQRKNNLINVIMLYILGQTASCMKLYYYFQTKQNKLLSSHKSEYEIKIEYEKIEHINKKVTFNRTCHWMDAIHSE